MNYFQFHIGDYVKHTTHLSPLEDLAYRRLLDFYYDSESPIPTAIPLVSRRLRMNEEIIKTVLSEFFVLTEKGWANSRVDKEIASYRAFLGKQKANGIKGGRPTKNPKKPTANPSLTQQVTQNNPNHYPLPTTHEPITPIPPDGRSGIRSKEAEDKLQSAFALFWSAYPKKTAKPAALKAFRAQRVNGELPAILGDIERRSSGVDWQKEGGQFVPNPTTYLNQRRWEDGNPVNQNQAMAGAV